MKRRWRFPIIGATVNNDSAENLLREGANNLYFLRQVGLNNSCAISSGMTVCDEGLSFSAQ